MQNEFSTTQATNLTALAGVIVFLLSKVLHIEIAQADVLAILGAVVTVVGIVMNYVHRYQKGDVTLGGFRK